MAAGPNSTPGDATDKKKWLTILVPAVGVGSIVILAAIVASVTDGTQPTGKGRAGNPGGSGAAGAGVRERRSPLPTDLTKLSDGTAPAADDGGLQPLVLGLAYRDLKVGDGPEVAPGASVVVDYVGWRRSDGVLFDSSFKADRGPFTADLGGGVIKGWMKGVPGMKVGGVRKLVIPPELAYGSRGAGRDIPPDATLVFEIEVLGIN